MRYYSHDDAVLAVLPVIGWGLLSTVWWAFETLLCTFIAQFSSLLVIFVSSDDMSVSGSHLSDQFSTYSLGLDVVPIPTSRKYPTAYIAFARPPSAAFFAHKNASVSD